MFSQRNCVGSIVDAVFCESIHLYQLDDKGYWKMVKNERRQLFDGECAYCSKQLNKPTLDHFIPWSKGGRHHPHNLIPSCRECNRKKGDQSPEYWYKKQKFYSSNRWSDILLCVGELEIENL